MGKCRAHVPLCKNINIIIILFILALALYGYTFLTGNQTRSVSPLPHKNASNILRQSNYFTKTITKLEHFNETITKPEKKMFETLMKTFSENIPWNVTYFLYSGTLLGSYRHHGMIPWDDDLDLLVRNEDKHELEDYLSSMTNYQLIMDGDQSWKFFHKSSINTTKPWKWPFLDLFFYLENATHIWDSHRSWRHKKYLKTDIFPLTKRRFMEMPLPAPRNTRHVLEALFNLEICESKFYDHKHEIFMESSTVVQLPCKDLEFKFPFVRREYFTNRTVETLVNEYSNEHLSKFTVVLK